MRTAGAPPWMLGRGQKANACANKMKTGFVLTRPTYLEMIGQEHGLERMDGARYCPEDTKQETDSSTHIASSRVGRQGRAVLLEQVVRTPSGLLWKRRRRVVVR